MKKNRILLPLFTVLLLALTLLCALHAPAQAAEPPAEPVTPAIVIDKARVQLGEPLTAAVTAPEGLDYTVSWYRAGLHLSDGASYTPVQEDCSCWLVAQLVDNATHKPVAEDAVFVSQLPVLYLDLPDNLSPNSIEKGIYVTANMRLQGNSQWKEQYNGVTEIKGRGNTTWALNKKPYKLKLDKKTDFFGMGKNKHYVLIANFLDRSLMRNKIAYDLSGELGLVQMESTWVEVIFNGVYWGNYQLCEHVRVDPATPSSRVPVYDWEDLSESTAKLAFPDKADKTARSALEDQMNEDMSWITSGEISFFNPATEEKQVLDLTASGYDPTAADISGGYLFELSAEYDELSKFTVSTKTTELKVMINTPEFLYSNSDMMKYCQDYWQAFLDAICAPDGYVSTAVTKDGYLASPRRTHYSELVDVDSMAEYFLTMEIMGNEDAAKKSRYAYKGQGELLKFGPVWDFDWGCGSKLLDLEPQTSSSPEGWKVNNYDQGNPANFYKELTDDPFFCVKVKEKFDQIRPYLTNLIKTDGIMDGYYDYLAISGQTNAEHWPAYYNIIEMTGTFQQEYTSLKTYLTQRFAWLDQQFVSFDTLLDSLRNYNSAAPYVPSDSLDFLYDADTHALTVTLQGDAAAVDLYINGVYYGQRDFVNRQADFGVLPAHVFTEGAGKSNVLSAVAKSGKGDTLAQNFTTVIGPQEMSAAITVSTDHSAIIRVLNPETEVDAGTQVIATLFDAATHTLSGVAVGTLKADGTVTFQAPVTDAWSLYFLAPNTYSPLCTPLDLTA